MLKYGKNHAHAILDIFSKVFQDIDEEDLEGLDFSDFFDEDEDGDDMNDMNELLNDSELTAIDWDELSSSNMFAENSTFCEDSKDLESIALHPSRCR